MWGKPGRKMLMKRQAIIFLLILCMICLSGCGLKPAEPNTNLPKNDGAVIRQDPDGLVEVRVEKENAKISFNLDKWDELYRVKAYSAENYPDLTLKSGPFPVTGLSGRVKDACVGIISTLDWNEHGFISPTIILLMEDGRLEWLLADLFTSELSSLGELPWLKDIVSLSYEKDNEGEMTILATDKGGSRCDVRSFCSLTSVFEHEWVCEIGPAPDDDTECIFLTLREDGGLSLYKGLMNMGDAYVFYTGLYTVEFAGPRPVLNIELWNELDIDLANPDFSSPPELSGKYAFEADWLYLNLYYAEGDFLDSDARRYPFWQPAMQYGYTGWDYYGFDGGDEANSRYIIENYCDETMSALSRGLTAQFREETVTLGGEVCHIFHMKDGSYTENTYAVNVPVMKVYRFDESKDEYVLVE